MSSWVGSVKRFLLVLVGVALVLSGVAWALGLGRERNDGLGYTLAAAEHGRITDLVNATGVVQPRETFTIGTEAAGAVVEVRATFNQTVEENELLLRLDDRLARQRLEQAEQAVDLARVVVRQSEAERDAAEINARTARQRDPAVRQPGELELAEARLRSAQGAVEAATIRVKEAEETQRQTDLAVRLTEVRVPVLVQPITGPPPSAAARPVGTGRIDLTGGPVRDKRSFTILERKVSLGQQVGPPLSGQLFVLAGDLSRVFIHAQVVEGDINKVAVGQTAEFTVAGAAEGEPPFTGKVTEVRLLPTNNHGAVFYEVLVEAANRRQPGIGDWHLRPGLTANVDIVRRAREAWKVPLGALNYQPELGELTPAAAARLERVKTFFDPDAWRTVWTPGPDQRPWPIFVKVVEGNDQGIQDAQFAEVFAWDPDLHPTPDVAQPGTIPQLIISAAPPKKQGWFSMPKIKF